ncbi:unnamed protein product [Rotaria sordida]|uniref:O-acyltransferase n=1 Tax=Rotaria sordida TaxID=392033 RepID=A0A815APB7_9BILA|nr:unnamed protein product [Rotaria sordida]
MAHMEETISNNDESQWIKQKTEKVHLKLLFELHGFKNEINEQFNSLKTNLDLQQKKPLEMLTMNSSSRQITESRIFIHRNSLLTDLFQISHIQGLRNVLVAILIIFIIQVTIDDIIEDGRLNLDFNLIFESFADLHIALFIWLIMQLSTAIIVFMGFYYWTKNRYNYRKHLKSKSNEEKFLCPDFSQYLYFLFVPTLIYRDQYPRNKIIRWSFVLKMFGEFIICIFYAYYIVVRSCIPTYENLNKTKITLSMFISILFNSIMPGSFFLLLSSYGFLHCWLNAFAEMLRFADRMFYNDWWNSTSFAAYYRTSNVVVHDWLYTYVYREIYILMGRKSRSIPTICVVLLSAIFHEYVMVFALGFFYPVIFLVFGVVGLVCLFCLPRQESVTYNILVWILLFIGVGLQSCLYFMETYARKSCPSNNTFWDKLIPRSFVCYISLPSSKHLKIDL